VAKLFSFDAETNGLYGEVWAVGAVLLGAARTEAGMFPVTFSGQLDPSVVTDPWTREHVVPVVDLPRYETRVELLDTFWAFWLAHRTGADCVGDFAAPVEAGLFRACVELDVAGRQWNGPYPLHELGTLLLARGLDPELDRREFAGRLDLVAHDPLADAMAQALCWQKAFHG
jgi:hypothetical protein